MATPIEPVLQVLYDLLRGYKTIKGKMIYLEGLEKSLIKPDRVKDMQFLL